MTSLPNIQYCIQLQLRTVSIVDSSRYRFFYKNRQHGTIQRCPIATRNGTKTSGTTNYSSKRAIINEVASLHSSTEECSPHRLILSVKSCSKMCNLRLSTWSICSITAKHTTTLPFQILTIERDLYLGSFPIKIVKFSYMGRSRYVFN